MTKIPANAREVYVNDQGEPIAWCPVDSLGVTDLRRCEFYRLNMSRLAELAERARTKERGTGERFGVVCIDVDDPTWTFLVDTLMPGHDWNVYREKGEVPVARGVVPLEIVARVLPMHPAAGTLYADSINIVVFAAGGIAIIPHQETT